MSLLKKIKETKSIKELDDLRVEIIQAGADNFEVHQQAFIKQKNKVKRLEAKLERWAWKGMKWKERESEKKKAKDSHLYYGSCLRCKQITAHLDKESDLCFSCEQDDLEFEEKRNASPYDPNDKEAEFKHYKNLCGWGDDKDEEIWNEHFRFN